MMIFKNVTKKKLYTAIREYQFFILNRLAMVSKKQ